MNLFGLNISLSRRSAPAAQPASQLSSQAQAWLRGEDSPTPAAPPLSSAYEQVVWVYRAVNAIAEQIASTPFVFSRGQRGRESLITSGPLLDFYSHPHPRLNAFQYWELRILWLLLRGECVRIPIFESAAGSFSSSSSSSSSSSAAAPKLSEAAPAPPKPNQSGPVSPKPRQTQDPPEPLDLIRQLRDALD